jgi:cell division septal protein FtsQ
VNLTDGSVRASADVVPLPVGRRPSIELDRIVPSSRALLVAVLLVSVAVGLFHAARSTALFELRSVEVVGTPPPVARKARAALASLRGSSLATLDAGTVERRLEALPFVRSAEVDRAFPHTLRVLVVPEQALAVVRRGADAWLVASDGRIIAALPRRRRPALPRIWVGRGAKVVVGERIPGEGEGALRTLAPLAQTRFLARVRDVRAGSGELTLLLRSGLELRLGDRRELGLKLAVARRIAPGLTREEEPPDYLDLAVPTRPVAGRNSQVEG